MANPLKDFVEMDKDYTQTIDYLKSGGKKIPSNYLYSRRFLKIRENQGGDKGFPKSENVMNREALEVPTTLKKKRFK